MRRLPTRLDGPLLIEPTVYPDERGFFVETFHRARYLELGIDADFVQDNHSRSVQGTIRGLHLQLPPGQPKLVRVARGRAFDVVVDLRPESPTFRNWESFELDDERHHQLFVPGGFAHGFCVLSETCDFVYKVGRYYDPAMERGLAWDDPELSIRWPVTQPIVSTRDQKNQSLRELVAELRR